jgi:acetyl-CoA carboxylase alpha subunit
MQFPRTLDLVRAGEFDLVERRACRFDMPFGKMQIDGSGLEVGMAEQRLQGRQVGACFQQMSSVAVPTIPAPE